MAAFRTLEPVSVRVLVTGSSGLVGSALVGSFVIRGWDPMPFDLRAADSDSRGDVRDPDAVSRAIEECDGVVHLAAVSRVVWGQQDPASCWSTNVDGTRVVLEAATNSRRHPWLVFSSSREVYGEPKSLPVREDAPSAPVNVYGRAKVVGEQLVMAARVSGLNTAVARFSNVYGSADDYADRVVPAFARSALLGTRLRLDGPASTFDFTHVTDVVRGLIAMIERLARGEALLDPVHFVSGIGTTLRELADLTCELAGTDPLLDQQEPRSYDVARFVGDPSRAREALGWEPRVSLRDGVADLIEQFRSREGR